MARKGMSLKELESVFKRCKDIYKVRYVCPTIHPRAKTVVAFTIYSDEETIELSITNNSDINFNLFNEINEYLDILEEKQKIKLDGEINI